jgi:hypothetical protein
MSIYVAQEETSFELVIQEGSGKIELEAVVHIANSQATDGVTNREICQRTGFLMLPRWHPESKLIKDGYGDWVRAKSADERHPQDHLASGRNTPHEGPQNAESSTDSFISTSVAAENL